MSPWWFAVAVIVGLPLSVAAFAAMTYVAVWYASQPEQQGEP